MVLFLGKNFYKGFLHQGVFFGVWNSFSYLSTYQLTKWSIKFTNLWCILWKVMLNMIFTVSYQVMIKYIGINKFPLWIALKHIWSVCFWIFEDRILTRYVYISNWISRANYTMLFFAQQYVISLCVIKPLRFRYSFSK